MGTGENLIRSDEAAGANEFLVTQQAGDEADGRIWILRGGLDRLAAILLEFLLCGLDGAHLIGLLLLRRVGVVQISRKSR